MNDDWPTTRENTIQCSTNSSKNEYVTNNETNQSLSRSSGGGKNEKEEEEYNDKTGRREEEEEEEERSSFGFTKYNPTEFGGFETSSIAPIIAEPSELFRGLSNGSELQFPCFNDGPIDTM